MKKSKLPEKINSEIIMNYHKKNKFKNLLIVVILGTIIIYSMAFYRRGSDITITECINIFPSIVLLIAILFFFADIIKWSLERFGVFTPREERIKKFALEQIEKMYNYNEIDINQYEKLNNMYK